jgi:hypothetical protein
MQSAALIILEMESGEIRNADVLRGLRTDVGFPPIADIRLKRKTRPMDDEPQLDDRLLKRQSFVATLSCLN